MKILNVTHSGQMPASFQEGINDHSKFTQFLTDIIQMKPSKMPYSLIRDDDVWMMWLCRLPLEGQHVFSLTLFQRDRAAYLHIDFTIPNIDTVSGPIPTPAHLDQDLTNRLFDHIVQNNVKVGNLFFVDKEGYILDEYEVTDVGTYMKVTPLNMTEAVELAQLNKDVKVLIHQPDYIYNNPGITDEMLNQCVDNLTPAELTCLASLKEDEMTVNPVRMMVFIRQKSPDANTHEFLCLPVADAIRIIVPNKKEK